MAKKSDKERKRALEYMKEYGPSRKKRLIDEGICYECGKNPPYSRKGKICEPCLARYRTRNKARADQLRAAGVCFRCLQPHVGGSLRCESCVAYGKRQQQLLKREVMDAYGGKCSCCGEANIGFLSIDHVNNDGKEHRKVVSGGNLYAWLKKNGFPQDGFQCLCFNCNCGKAKNGGICPHLSP